MSGSQAQGLTRRTYRSHDVILKAKMYYSEKMQGKTSKGTGTWSKKEGSRCRLPEPSRGGHTGHTQFPSNVL